MSLETYWMVVPIAGIALTVPVWGWLLLTRRRHQHDADPHHPDRHVAPAPR